MKDLKYYILAVAVLVALFWLSASDYQAEIKADTYHCEMVAQWNAGAAHGVAEIDRAGWPDYKGTCNK